MRIKTIEQSIALKQLKGTPRSMAVQLHPLRQRTIFQICTPLTISLIVPSKVHGYDSIKHKSSSIVV